MKRRGGAMGRAGRRAFTLLEVMIALAVVTIAIGAVLSQSASFARNAGYLTDKTLAVWVARNRLSELELAAALPPVSDVFGDAQMAGRTWYWRQQVSATPVAQIRRVDLYVFDAPPRGGKANSAALVELSGFLGVPGGATR